MLCFVYFSETLFNSNKSNLVLWFLDSLCKSWDSNQGLRNEKTIHAIRNMLMIIYNIIALA